MSSTSASGGFLAGSPARSKIELENLFHALICGLTGLDKTLVRPRYQPKGAKIPPAGVSWCAFGITQVGGTGPEVIHNGAEEGYDTLFVHREVQLLLSFYGPDALDDAQTALDGLSVWQNRALLRQNEIGFTRGGPITPVPGQAEFGWLDRQDLPLYFSARQTRRYAVLNIKSATPLVITE